MEKSGDVQSTSLSQSGMIPATGEQPSTRPAEEGSTEAKINTASKKSLSQSAANLDSPTLRARAQTITPKSLAQSGGTGRPPTLEMMGNISKEALHLSGGGTSGLRNSSAITSSGQSTGTPSRPQSGTQAANYEKASSDWANTEKVIAALTPQVTAKVTNLKIKLDQAETPQKREAIQKEIEITEAPLKKAIATRDEKKELCLSYEAKMAGAEPFLRQESPRPIGEGKTQTVTLPTGQTFEVSTHQQIGKGGKSFVFFANESNKNTPFAFNMQTNSGAEPMFATPMKDMPNVQQELKLKKGLEETLKGLEAKDPNSLTTPEAQKAHTQQIDTLKKNIAKEDALIKELVTQGRANGAKEKMAAEQKKYEILHARVGDGMAKEMFPRCFVVDPRDPSGNSYAACFGEELLYPLSGLDEKSLDEKAYFSEDVLKHVKNFQAKNVVHRDQKKDNLMQDKNGNAKIIDWENHFTAESLQAMNKEQFQMHIEDTRNTNSDLYCPPAYEKELKAIYGKTENCTEKELGKLKQDLLKLEQKKDLYGAAMTAYEILFNINPKEGPEPLDRADKHSPADPARMLDNVMKLKEREPEMASRHKELFKFMESNFKSGVKSLGNN